jgi:hypothetical protein
MDATSVLLSVVGQSPTDRIVVAAAWVGLITLAAIIFVGSARTPRMWRR